MKTYLEVPFNDRLIVKAHGARWDPAAKKWYVPDGTDLHAFLDWVPKEGTHHTLNDARVLDALNGFGREKHTNKKRPAPKPKPPVDPEQLVQLLYKLAENETLCEACVARAMRLIKRESPSKDEPPWQST